MGGFGQSGNGIEFQSSSMVERAAVNRDVVGSSPTSGAIFSWSGDGSSLFDTLNSSAFPWQLAIHRIDVG